MPQQVMLSGYHQPTPTLAVMGNPVWQEWSAFGQVDVSIDGRTDDTFGVVLGLQHQVAPGWLWSVGGGAASSPMGESQRSPSLPLDAQYRVGTGIQHDLSGRFTVGVAYEHMHAGDADLDVEHGPLSGRLEGDYQSNSFHFINATLIWRF